MGGKRLKKTQYRATHYQPSATSKYNFIGASDRDIEFILNMCADTGEISYGSPTEGMSTCSAALIT